jgi:ABC-type dipeptide/oligopeptide/nickel transport system permease subunit
MLEEHEKMESKKKKTSFLRWLLWWQIDQDELTTQVSSYHLLKVTQSIRGQSLLLLIFSACATTVSIAFFSSPIANFIEVVISLLLGYFVFRGHKWAMVGAMLFWSFEKFILLYDGFQSYSPDHSSPNPIIHIIWWAIYMHAFYFSFMVEKARDKEAQAQIAVSSASAVTVGDLDELERLSEFKNKGIITEEEFNAKKKQILNL